ncbi:MAG: NADH-quinone oxidoreductase subunit C [Nitrospinaceae bacterium]|nr:NADH-quinone oxidoreductase subunit C [Nitrospina sp.]MBT5867446.1 NADH-quinone oxidoreductase subunit C [Nitrospinaceae bacterium]MBT6345316.1 NADH-quinone oxidoreductase subunit C [Nitrospina sp.]
MSDNKIIERIKSQYGSLIIDSHDFRGDQTVTVKKDCTIEFFKFLRDDSELDFNFLMDLTAVDYASKKDDRFEVVYHFYSLKHNHRLRIKIPVSIDDCIADSITPLWKTANWYEREIWDMYGIKFRGHPNLRRILLYEEFKGHPLRKDYPINKRQPLIGPLN